MDMNTDIVKGTEIKGETAINTSEDFIQRPDIGTVRNEEYIQIEEGDAKNGETSFNVG